MKGADALRARIRAAPRAHDPARGAEAAAALGVSGATAALIGGAAGSSPYLAGVIAREGPWLAEALEVAPETTAARLAAGLGDAPAAMRQAKRRAALLTALCDLGGVWDLDAATAALTRFADAAVAAAAEAALAAERGGPLAGSDARAAGLIVLALGKMGAGELNYSSDVDLIVLFDDERWGAEAAAARARLIKATQRMVATLSDVTAEGYVFRTDLRLRPNPSATPVCIATSAAEAYYESVGRTWERSAYIKARPVAGDLEAGAAFLAALRPFVWRRHLDFAAIEEAHEMLGKIRAHRTRERRDEWGGFDVKLGSGGIREIEFFAQTQQLVRGGRDARLRAPRTRDALAALAAAGVLPEADRAALDARYVQHRTLEHRLQMVDDAQTHAIPVAAEARERVAALAGAPDVEAMVADLAAACADVRARCDAFFAPQAHPGPAAPDAGALAQAGFQRPDVAAALLERWAGGGVAATRGERARRRFQRIAPLLVDRLACAASPDDAVAAFDSFLSGLPAGAQLFSLFEANPELLELLCEICAAAPRLAAYLGRNAGVLDSVLDRAFFSPLPDADALTAELEAALTPLDDYERKLDAARRWAKERQFRVGVHVLRGLASAAEAGRAFSAVAEACLRALHRAVTTAFAARHGPPPGRGWAVAALGKLGSAEMTATSDLDLIVICDPAAAESSEGPKPLASAVYYARLVQMLIAAMTAPTAEGTLFPVDMRLRPSGRKGPVAVRLPAFRAYHADSAWTWEHLALTRARVVAGDAALAADVAAEIATVRARPRDAAATLADVAQMRDRIAEARAEARGRPWALKHARGGLLDIELVVQAGVLLTGAVAPRSVAEAAPALAAAGWLSQADAAVLAEAHGGMSALQQVERVALDGGFDPDAAGPGLRAAMARAVGAADLAAAQAWLLKAQREADAVATRVLAG